MGNLPRVDPDTMRGIITDGAVKRRVRDYIEMFYDGQPGMDIYIRVAVGIRVYAGQKEHEFVPICNDTHFMNLLLRIKRTLTKRQPACL